jgi:Flp pilus assembly protein TadB
MSDIAYFRQQYARMGDEELAILSETFTRDPDSLVRAAKEALVQEIASRKTDISKLVTERAEYDATEQKRLSEKLKTSELKSARRTKHLERLMGILGAIGSVLIFIPSLLQGHLGGIFAAVATFVCSVWLIFKRGD